ncbi:hypothetical protein PMAYCL1PPCAC_03763 [Pristionchus mayeri]|uniref:Uncharacterized protein n=1 Tax=Pristionchus mayeri TaxID=1317129 RepID=A0AAN4Z5M3_9BILA|nr:hypothetical protein PMAYCL1PPCAC_03763 [Pristionchus mayeri]
MRVQLRVEDVDALLAYLFGAVCRTVAGQLEVRLMGRNRDGVAVDYANLDDSRVIEPEVRSEHHVEAARVDQPLPLRRIIPVQLHHHVRIVSGAAHRDARLDRVLAYRLALGDGADDLGAGLGLRRLRRVVAVALELLLVSGVAVEEHHVVH